MKIFLSLGLILISSCFIGGGPYQPAPRAGDAEVKIVQRLWNPNATSWRNSKWYRSSITTPSRVVISTSDYACIMRDGEVKEPRSQENYKCLNGWIPPRNYED